MDDVCHHLDWNPLAVGPSHSALAAVVAGFVFAGVVLVLGQPAPSSFHPRSLRLLISSFFILMLDSFFFSHIAGEQVCNRAWTELMIAAGLLGTGSLGVFSGLAWLTVDSSGRYAQATRYLAALARWIGVIVPFHLSITATYYLHDMYGSSAPPHLLVTSVRVSPAAIVVASMTITLLQRFGPYRAGSGSIRNAAYASVAYGIISSACIGLASGQLPESGRPPLWVIETSVGSALSLSAVAVIAHTLALPPIDAIATAGHDDDPRRMPPHIPRPGRGRNREPRWKTKQ